MNYQVTWPGGPLRGTINLTASKSESNRALVVQALSDEPFQIHNLAVAEDTQTLLTLLNSEAETLDVGPAGTTMRFLVAYLARKQGARVITGSARMKERPIGILVDALRDLGAEIKYVEKEGYPPLYIQGKALQGGTVRMDGNVSSQFVSALLLIAPTLPEGLTIQFTGDIASRPYLEMTIRMLRYFGATVHFEGQTITVQPGGYTAKDFTVEADWSAASYWYEMAAFASEVDLTLHGLRRESLQGDAVVHELYEQFGVKTEWLANGVRLTKQTLTPSPLHYDFDDCPDIAQTLACSCAGLQCAGAFSGLKSLRIKETDRSLALQTELSKFGTTLHLQGDEALTIPAPVHFEAPNQTIATYHDHRMAMAFAPLAMLGQPVKIENPLVVGKSYPDYWKDLKKVGFQILEG